MKPKNIKYIAILIGLISVVISITFSNNDTRYIKPLFHIALLWYYFLNVTKVKPFVFVFFGSAMVGEFLVAKDFEANFEWISLCFILCFISGVILLIELLRSTKFKFRGTDVLALLLAIGGLSYLVGSVYFISIEQLKDFSYFSIATISFVLFITSCFFISGFHHHPKKIFLFVTAACYLIVCLGTLIYELQTANVYLLGIVNLSEVVAQLCFAYFMVHFRDVAASKTVFL